MVASANTLAFDRASARSYDADDRLHVSATVISNAIVGDACEIDQQTRVQQRCL
jgi:hypothetical protein